MKVQVHMPHASVYFHLYDSEAFLSVWFVRSYVCICGISAMRDKYHAGNFSFAFFIIVYSIKILYYIIEDQNTYL